MIDKLTYVATRICQLFTPMVDSALMLEEKVLDQTGDLESKAFHRNDSSKLMALKCIFSKQFWR